MDLVKVKDNNDIARDKNSNAVVYINTDKTQAILKQRRLSREQRETIRDLKKEVTELKELLYSMLEKK